MKLEDQVCSLDLSRKLKELGVKQESIVYWWSNSTAEEVKDYLPVFKESIVDRGLGTRNIISAFTASELGEILPGQYQIEGFTYFLNSWWHAPNEWQVGYCLATGIDPYAGIVTTGSEADARARMLIHLLEKGMLNASEIK